MKQSYSIVALPGDGIGPEVLAQGLRVLRAFPVKKLLDLVLAQLGAKNLERTPNTMIFNQSGQPAMNVPLHWNAAGLPPVSASVVLKWP